MRKATVKNIKEKLPIKIFTHSQIEPIIKTAYSRPNDKIRKLINDGELIRVKKGVYTYEENLPKEYISAALVQPSYISFEYALSFYGMIPERVYHCTAATTKREKEFSTKWGIFYYKQVPLKAFHLGITWHFDREFGGSFFATPEKALCDKIKYDRGIGTLTQGKMLDYLLEDLRIDFSQVSLDYKLIIDIGIAYGSKNIKTLALLVEKGAI